jgi:hypothetical protein
MSKAEKIEAPNDVARLALSEAIRDRQEADRLAAAANAAVERAVALTEAAETRLAVAKSILATWRNEATARALAIASTGTAPPSPEMSAREARAEAQDSEDANEAASAARVACMAALSDAEDLAHRAQTRVEAAVAPILCGGIDRVLSEAESLRSELHGKYAVLVWLRDLLPFGGEQRQRLSAALPPPPPPGVTAPAYQPPADWIAARQALMRDANAALPL